MADPDTLPAVTDHGTFPDVLICTFDNAASLDGVLTALGDERQSAALVASYERGRCAGTARIALLLATRRCEFFGGVPRTCEDSAA